MSEKLFKLIWTSQKGAVTLDRGEYASISAASADLPAAEVHIPAHRIHGFQRIVTTDSSSS